MSEHKISVTKTLRYFTHGSSDQAKYLLIALHGYGQLPEYFVRKFAHLSNEYFVVAPEGMHRFYLKGSSGRVGASWMTKEARLDDIADNLGYLELLLNELTKESNFERIVLLGFSQGGATAARFFFSQTHFKIDQLILWGSVFPPDVSVPSADTNSTHTSTKQFVVGLHDPYFSPEDRKELSEYFQSIGFKVYLYDGLHDIHAETLSELLA